jgi:hypothetical protein
MRSRRRALAVGERSRLLAGGHHVEVSVHARRFVSGCAGHGLAGSAQHADVPRRLHVARSARHYGTDPAVPTAGRDRVYRFEPVGFEPKPIQRPIPVWVGGATPAAFERTARFGHGFHAAFQPLDMVAREWQAVRAACVARKRDPNELTLSLRLYLDPAGQMEPEKSIAGTPAQMGDRLAELERSGGEPRGAGSGRARRRAGASRRRARVYARRRSVNRPADVRTIRAP